MSGDSARSDAPTAAGLLHSGEREARDVDPSPESCDPPDVETVRANADPLRAEKKPPSASSLSTAAPLLDEIAVGTVIDGKYRIDGLIGRGAMGVVTKAMHVHLQERVAIKFLDVRANETVDDFRARFRREAQVSAKLRNEHITRVHDLGLWKDKIPFMVMDYLAGVDLAQRLGTSTQLSVSCAVDYIVQVCEGMAEAHANGIVHRDLKPSNLFVTKRADGSELVRILDFGISKWTAADEKLDALTQSGVILGTPKYMAPEQLFGTSEVDARADIWSIGAILFQMLAGRAPFNESTLTRHIAELAARTAPGPLRKLNPGVPPALEQVVLRCLTYNLDARIRDVAELAGASLGAIGAPDAGEVEQKLWTILNSSPNASTASTASGLARPQRARATGARRRSSAPRKALIAAAVLAGATAVGAWSTRHLWQRSVPGAAAQTAPATTERAAISEPPHPVPAAAPPPMASDNAPSSVIANTTPSDPSSATPHASTPTAPRGPSAGTRPTAGSSTGATPRVQATASATPAPPAAVTSADPAASADAPRERPKRRGNPLQERQ